MRHIVEAGTDVASVALFDPGSLPDDFEARFKKDPFGLFEALEKQGRACLLNVGADGGYLLYAYVDEPIPSELQKYAVDPIIFDTVTVATGCVYFTGAEGAFRDTPSFLRKYPGMGSSFLVRPGIYRVTFFRTEYPEGLCEGQLQARVSTWAFRLQQNMGCFVALAAAAVLGIVGGYNFAPWEVWLTCILPPLFFVMLLPLFVTRIRQYREADKIWKSIERNYPSLIAKMELTRE